MIRHQDLLGYIDLLQFVASQHSIWKLYFIKKQKVAGKKTDWKMLQLFAELWIGIK